MVHSISMGDDLKIFPKVLSTIVPYTYVAWDQTSGTNGGTAAATTRGGSTAFSLTSEDAFITVTPVNDAPTDIALSNSSVAENSASGTTVGTFSSTDVDTGDTFTYSLVTGTGSTDNASFTISGNTLKTAASFNYEVNNSYSIRVRTTDAGGLTFDKVFTIGVTDGNDAPVLNNSGDPILTTITEDPASNPGNLVSELIASMSPAGSITDEDAGALQGIAVIGANQNNGTWQFSTNGGTTWSNFGSTSSSSALLLASNANTRIRFTPNANYNGSVGFTYVPTIVPNCDVLTFCSNASLPIAVYTGNEVERRPHNPNKGEKTMNQTQDQAARKQARQDLMDQLDELAQVAKEIKDQLLELIPESYDLGDDYTCRMYREEAVREAKYLAKHIAELKF